MYALVVSSKVMVTEFLTSVWCWLGGKRMAKRVDEEADQRSQTLACSSQLIRNRGGGERGDERGRPFERFRCPAASVSDD